MIVIGNGGFLGSFTTLVIRMKAGDDDPGRGAMA